MDIGAYFSRQKYWLRQASKEGRGLSEFFCIIGRSVRLVAERATAPVRLRIGNRKRAGISASTPVKDDLVFFYTFQGDYTCNPKYIYKELAKRDIPFKAVWSAGKRTGPDRSPDFPPECTLVREGSREFYEALAAARVWVINSTEFLKKPMPKKADQFVMQTWHGSLGIKRFGKEVIKGSELAGACEFSSNITDVIISNSEFEDNVYRETYWADNTIERWGHARNDILINEDELKEAASGVRRFFDIPEGAGIALYAPTFRDDHLFDDYSIDAAGVIESLSEQFGGEWYLLVRFHPSVRAEAVKFRQSGAHIADATEYPDIQELMAAADVAITDYSSWIYDFILTGRPGFIFACDSEKYERSFYYPLSETPFPVASDNEGLMANIRNFDEAEYRVRLKEFLDGKGCIDDGNASARAADCICKILTFK